MFQLRKLALQLVLVKKSDNLYVGVQNVFKDTKQDRQVELLFTEERCNYSNKSVKHQQSVHFSDTQSSQNESQDCVRQGKMTAAVPIWVCMTEKKSKCVSYS